MWLLLALAVVATGLAALYHLKRKRKLKTARRWRYKRPKEPAEHLPGKPPKAEEEEEEYRPPLLQGLPPPPPLPPVAYEREGYWQVRAHCKPIQMVFWIGRPPKAEQEEEEDGVPGKPPKAEEKEEEEYRPPLLRCRPPLLQKRKPRPLTPEEEELDKVVSWILEEEKKTNRQWEKAFKQRKAARQVNERNRLANQKRAEDKEKMD